MRFYEFTDQQRQQALIAEENEWRARKRAVQECGLPANVPAVEWTAAEAFSHFKPLFLDAVGDDSDWAQEMAERVFKEPGVILTNIPNV